VKIQSEQRDQILVIALSGSFDALTADQVRRYMGREFEGGQQHVALDLSRVDFMSSSGIRVLLEAFKQARSLGGDLRLAAAQPGVQRSLEIAGLVRVLNTYPSVDEAVRSFRS
jgi:anti-anti-sigma factor